MGRHTVQQGKARTWHGEARHAHPPLHLLRPVEDRQRPRARLYHTAAAAAAFPFAPLVALLLPVPRLVLPAPRVSAAADTDTGTAADTAADTARDGSGSHEG